MPQIADRRSQASPRTSRALEASKASWRPRARSLWGSTAGFVLKSFVLQNFVPKLSGSRFECHNHLYTGDHTSRDHLLIRDSSRVSIEISGILSRNRRAFEIQMGLRDTCCTDPGPSRYKSNGGGRPGRLTITWALTVISMLKVSGIIRTVRR